MRVMKVPSRMHQPVVTVGQLKTFLADLPDDRTVCIEGSAIVVAPSAEEYRRWAETRVVHWPPDGEIDTWTPAELTPEEAAEHIDDQIRRYFNMSRAAFVWAFQSGTLPPHAMTAHICLLLGLPYDD